MRAQTIVLGLLQAALLVACHHPKSESKATETARDNAGRPASAVVLGKVGQPTASPEEVEASAREGDNWFRSAATDPVSRLIVRTGQAGIEVDSLEPSMAELRRIVQRAGGFVADAAVQSGRNQLRSATLQVKVPASRFDDLTGWLEPLGRLQYVNVSAEDVSEEFVDLSARVENAHRLEERLLELLRTRAGKLQEVLTVERELARVREEIERMEGRMRFLKTRAELSTLSVNLYEPAPILASPGHNAIVQGFKTAWRNFVGLLAGAIASLGFVVPLVLAGWSAALVVRRYRRKPA
jgi:uncharacterized protein DUF4349